MNDSVARLGLLIIGEPIALAKLAKAGLLDRLLGYRHIIIPDETAYEAKLRFAALPAVDDPDRLKRWIDEQATAGRVSCPTTWLGKLAVKARSEGGDLGLDDSGLHVALHYATNRNRADDHGLVTFLIDDSGVYRSLERDNVQTVGIKVLLETLGYSGDYLKTRS